MFRKNDEKKHQGPKKKILQYHKVHARQSERARTSQTSHFAQEFTGKCRTRIPRRPFCASLRNRNAPGHFTRAFVWKSTGNMPHPHPTTSIKHRTFYCDCKNPYSVATLFGGTKGSKYLSSWLGTIRKSSHRRIGMGLMSYKNGPCDRLLKEMQTSTRSMLAKH